MHVPRVDRHEVESRMQLIRLWDLLYFVNFSFYIVKKFLFNANNN